MTTVNPTIQRIEPMIQEMPSEFQQEVEDFVNDLFEKHIKKPKSNRKLKLDWRGALSDMKDQYTSVELQHKILEMRGEYVSD
ncbi:MAG: DUF2281 domain-containing protein [Anaerolineales bacterium]